MGDFTKIEWTGSTWNPIRARLKRDAVVPTKANPLRILAAGTWGYHCERISPGCSATALGWTAYYRAVAE